MTPVFSPSNDTYDKASLSHYCDLLAEREFRIAGIIKKYGYPPFWHREPTFESLVMIILEQQVSLASAFAVYNRLKDQVGMITPDRVAHLTDQKFRSCGISRQKTSYLRGLAEKIKDRSLDLRLVNSLPTEEIRAELIKLKGIGDWTIDVYLMSCLHKLDIFPVGDLVLVKSLRQIGLISEKMPKERIIRRSNKFKPFRSILTILMWHYYINENNLNIPFDL